MSNKECTRESSDNSPSVFPPLGHSLHLPSPAQCAPVLATPTSPATVFFPTHHSGHCTPYLSWPRSFTRLPASSQFPPNRVPCSTLCSSHTAPPWTAQTLASTMHTPAISSAWNFPPLSLLASCPLLSHVPASVSPGPVPCSFCCVPVALG